MTDSTNNSRNDRGNDRQAGKPLPGRKTPVVPLERLPFEPSLHKVISPAHEGYCSWHGRRCPDKPVWSYRTPMGMVSACERGSEQIEERYGSPNLVTGAKLARDLGKVADPQPAKKFTESDMAGKLADCLRGPDAKFMGGRFLIEVIPVNGGSLTDEELAACTAGEPLEDTVEVEDDERDVK
ncbi:hypothetical protein [Streptomyces sp. NBC_01190]|uniref:hypothetical protein n=1 Tax=Streptomyces sp. NBC_01190 TaxID=2903767 RepID=UPI00386AF920|nr:hypothetical protein OG519_07345 [Streptomyces sp. NBC_01190]